MNLVREGGCNTDNFPIKDISIRPVHINALTKFLKGSRPGTALIGVAKLGNPKLKFEIEAIAAIKPGSGAASGGGGLA